MDIVGKFAKVKSDKYSEYGLDQGDTVCIIGSGFSPIDNEDNYKLLFVAAKIVDGAVGDKQGVTMARTSLEVLSDEENETLRKSVENAFEQRAAKEKEAN